ncbi:MAG: histidinol-phosphatase [Oscillospiraceae bacterium]|nr:histidinol-phosphatase [Oscillospiraceae bacterium]
MSAPDLVSGYTDVHCHILPGVDDGSPNMEDSLKLLDMAYEEGIRFMILTPHYVPGEIETDPVVLSFLFNDIIDAAAEKHPDMELYLGTEIYFRPRITEKIRAGMIPTMNGTRYVLVEFDNGVSERVLTAAVGECTLNGFIPVIAHMERYVNLVRNIRLIEDLIHAGAYMQMNTGSLAGGFFDRRAAMCRKLLKEGYIHLLGTDCHRPGWRTPKMKTVFEGLKQEEQNIIKKIMTENVPKLLSGEYI